MTLRKESLQGIMDKRAAPEQQKSLLFQVPFEVRHAILDFLRDAVDITPVMHACKQLRHDVFSRLPSGGMINYDRHFKEEMMPEQPGSGLAQAMSKILDVRMVNIIAEPSYSPGHALRFEIAWSYRDGLSPDLSSREHTTSWAVRDHSSILAWLASVFWDVACRNDPKKGLRSEDSFDPRPSRLQITFCAPPVGQHSFTALMILRTKVLDIIQVLEKLIWGFNPLHAYDPYAARPREQFQLVFATPADANPHRRSFWELRPQESRNGSPYPYFYELLMCPFEECTDWKFGELRFDRKPNRKRTSAVRLVGERRRWDPERENRQYKGWDFLSQPCSSFESRYSVERIDEWGRQESFLIMVDLRTIAFNCDLLAMFHMCRGPRVVQLRDHLRRTVNYGGAGEDSCSCKWQESFHDLVDAFPHGRHDDYLPCRMPACAMKCTAWALLDMVQSVTRIMASRQPRAKAADALLESLEGAGSIDASLGVKDVTAQTSIWIRRPLTAESFR